MYLLGILAQVMQTSMRSKKFILRTSNPTWSACTYYTVVVLVVIVPVPVCLLSSRLETFAQTRTSSDSTGTCTTIP